MTWLTKLSILTLVSGTAFASNVRSQIVSDAPKPVNFGYSRNPKTKKPVVREVKKPQPSVTLENRDALPEAENKPDIKTEVLISDNKTPSPAPAPEQFENYSSAAETLEIAKRAPAAATSPTEIYKIGVGDVLFISLQNTGTKAATYFTVLGDGTIDYPLASEMVTVAGLSTDEIEELLKEKVKLYENPEISVRVREHASHSITVLGLVEKSGEKFLQREAIPLYVVKADAVVQAKSNQLTIKRANASTEILDLKDSKNDEVLIFPGDILEFKSTETAAENSVAPRFYYIGGEIKSAGQKEFYAGITLTQAILASGGLRKSSVKRVIIRRKNEQGLLTPTVFDLIAIKDGKQPDPAIEIGDTIEIVKN